MTEAIEKGWRPAWDLRFAAGLEAIALAVSELPFVAQTIPVGFIKANGSWRAMAIFSPGDSCNRFVDQASGMWRGSWLPALLRAYPFMLRTQDGEARLTLWPTAKSEPMGEGVEPFLQDGQPTERIRKTISFLTGVQEEIGKAQAPLSLLEASATLLPWTPKGLDAPLVLGGAAVHAVDGEKFAALEDAAFLRLREMGALSWIYAHMQSLHCARALAVTPAEAASTVDLAWQNGPEAPQIPVPPRELMQAMAADLGDLDL